MDEHLAELQEEDVGEGQSNTETDIPSDSSSSLLGRKCYTHDGQDECRERQGESPVLFHQGELHICITSHFLSCNELIQLAVSQCFDRLLREIDVPVGQCYDSVHLLSCTDLVGKVIIVLSDEIFLESPAFARGVVCSSLCGNLGHKLVAFDLLESESVGSIVP